MFELTTSLNEKYVCARSGDRSSRQNLGTFQLVWESIAVRRRGFGSTSNNPMSREIALDVSQTFLAMLLRLVGTADTAGDCEKKQAQGAGGRRN